MINEIDLAILCKYNYKNYYFQIIYNRIKTYFKVNINFKALNYSMDLNKIRILIEEHLNHFNGLENKLKHNHPPMSILVKKCIYCTIFGNILINGPIKEDQF